jgi:predicted transcriptional regulator
VKTFSEPSDLELQILSLLWADGPLTARQVLERMPDGKPRAYTTILSVMQLMEKKRLLSRRPLGTAHVYRPAVSRTRVLGKTLGRLVKHAFGGNAAAAVQSLIRDTPISPEELKEIRELIDAHDARQKAGEDEP